MLKRLFSRIPTKKSGKGDLLDALEGMFNILKYQIQAGSTQSASRNIKKLREPLLHLFQMLEKNHQKFTHLCFNEAVIEGGENPIVRSFYQEAYAETPSLIVANLVELFKTSFKAENDELAREILDILVETLQEFAYKTSNADKREVLIGLVLNQLSTLHLEVYKEPRYIVRPLTMGWYQDTLFGYSQKVVPVAYLKSFHEQFEWMLRRFYDVPDDKIFESIVSMLHDGIHDSRWLLNTLSNIYFRKRSRQITVSFDYKELKQIVVQNYLSSDDFQVALNNLKVKFEEMKSSLLDKEDEITWEKVQSDFYRQYNYDQLQVVVFSTAAYYLFKNRLDLIYFMWEFHQPGDADATNCGTPVIPHDLTTLFELYFKAFSFSRRRVYWEDHHGSSKYLQRYFVLSLLRRLYRTPNSIDVGLSQFNMYQKSEIKCTCPSILKVANKLRQNTELMRQLGFPSEHVRLTSEKSELDLLYERLQSLCDRLEQQIDEDRQRTITNKAPDVQKIASFKKRLISGFTHSADVRQWFAKNKLYDRRLSFSFQSTVDENKFSIHVPKEVFFTDWDVDYRDFGTNLGSDFARLESEQMCAMIAAHCEPIHTQDLYHTLEKYIQEDIIKPENLVVFLSPHCIGKFLDFEKKFVNKWMSSPEDQKIRMLFGQVRVGEVFVPIYKIHPEEDMCLILDKSRLGRWVQHSPHSPDDLEGSEVLNKTFYFYLQAYSENETLLNKYLKENPDVKADELKTKMLFQWFEWFSFEPAQDFVGFKIGLEASQDEPEVDS